jgi:methionine-rich copper-binding protein CopC
MKWILSLLFVLLIVPAIVNAHVRMLESFPGENAVLNEPPQKVTLTFLGSVETMFSKIEVYDSHGKKVSNKKTFREDDTIMEVGLDDNLPEGQYTVKWICMSLDGHKRSGEYTFSIVQRR